MSSLNISEKCTGGAYSQKYLLCIISFVRKCLVVEIDRVTQKSSVGRQVGHANENQRGVYDYKEKR